MIGTSAIVYPAAGIPAVVKNHGGKVIEFNLERTEITNSCTDIFVMGQAGKTLPELVSALKKQV